MPHWPPNLRDTKFEALIAEATSVSVDGWDFAWLDGRATEERPPWGYARMLTDQVGRTSALLDVQTGGGEVVAEVLDHAASPPRRIAATEAWTPNAMLARRALTQFGGSVVEVLPAADLPFVDRSFDLVSSRHPVVTRFDEVARVLARAGRSPSRGIRARRDRPEDRNPPGGVS